MKFRWSKGRFGDNVDICRSRGPSHYVSTWQALLLSVLLGGVAPLGADVASPFTKATLLSATLVDGRADWRRPAARSALRSGLPEPMTVSMPVIDSIPAQIVSAGHVVRLTMGKRIGNERPPRLIIDRLPVSASFDENPDGSHTFYWPTSGDAQGEHRIRITALDPENGMRIGGVDVLIVVVGNPDYAATGPDLLFSSDPAATGQHSPDVTVASSSSVEQARRVEPVDDQPLVSDAYDPYDTYDEHPPYDPQTYFMEIVDPLDTAIAHEADDLPGAGHRSSTPDVALDQNIFGEQVDYFDERYEEQASLKSALRQ